MVHIFRSGFVGGLFSYLIFVFTIWLALFVATVATDSAIFVATVATDSAVLVVKLPVKKEFLSSFLFYLGI